MELENWVVVSNILYFHLYLGKIPNLTNIFQMGWNHQPEKKKVGSVGKVPDLLETPKKRNGWGSEAPTKNFSHLLVALKMQAFFCVKVTNKTSYPLGN